MPRIQYPTDDDSGGGVGPAGSSGSPTMLGAKWMDLNWAHTEPYPAALRMFRIVIYTGTDPNDISTYICAPIEIDPGTIVANTLTNYRHVKSITTATTIPNIKASVQAVYHSGNESSWRSLGGTVQLDPDTVVLGTQSGVDAAQDSGLSMARPFELWNGGFIHPTVTIADGKSGKTALRMSANAATDDGMYHQIDPLRKYKTRFWARAAAGTNGLLYFDLHQYTDNAGTTCATNGGRSPYSPNAVAAHTGWILYEHVWMGSDFQTGVKYIKCDLLGNYSGTTGYWEVQDFAFYDCTEMYDAQKMVDAVQDDMVLSRSEKPGLIGDYATATANKTSVFNKAASLGVNTEAMTLAFTALTTFLTSLGLTTTAWSDATIDTALPDNHSLGDVWKTFDDELIKLMLACQNAKRGLDWVIEVNCSVTSIPTSISGGWSNYAAIRDGAKILLAAQNTPAENGIYTSNDTAVSGATQYSPTSGTLTGAGTYANSSNHYDLGPTVDANGEMIYSAASSAVVTYAGWTGAGTAGTLRFVGDVLTSLGSIPGAVYVEYSTDAGSTWNPWVTQSTDGTINATSSALSGVVQSNIRIRVTCEGAQYMDYVYVEGLDRWKYIVVDTTRTSCKARAVWFESTGSVAGKIFTKSTVVGQGEVYAVLNGTRVNQDAAVAAKSGDSLTLAFTPSAAAAGGTVTGVTATAPVVASASTSIPNISMLSAQSGRDGYLTAADWATFNGKANTNDARFTDSRAASDVYAWAKAATDLNFAYDTPATGSKNDWSTRAARSGFYQSDTGAHTNLPTGTGTAGYMHIINCQHSNTANNFALQIATSFGPGGGDGYSDLFWRATGDTASSRPWRIVIDSSNIGSQTVAYANGLNMGSSITVTEAWGVNLNGTATQPAQVKNSSLLIGYGVQSGANYGSGNLYAAGSLNFNSTYGGSLYMTDVTWIRTGGKSVWLDGGHYGTSGGITCGYGGSAPPNGGASFAGAVGVGVLSPLRALHIKSASIGYGFLRLDGTGGSEITMNFRDASGTDELSWTVGKGPAGIGDNFGMYWNGSNKLTLSTAGALNVLSTASAYGFTGNANVGGTGSASYHPSGLYAGSYSWMYGGVTYGGGDLINIGSIRATTVYAASGTNYRFSTDVTTSAEIGLYFSDGSNGTSYWIGKRAGTWAQPLDINFYTGIRYHAHRDYGGHKYYGDMSDGIEIMSIGNGDNNVRIANDLYIGGLGNWVSTLFNAKAVHRGEGNNYVDYSRYVYDNGDYQTAGWKEPSAVGVYYAYLGRLVYNDGTYSGSGWVEASNLGVRYAASSGAVYCGGSGDYRNAQTSGTGWSVAQRDASGNLTCNQITSTGYGTSGGLVLYGNDGTRYRLYISGGQMYVASF